MLKTILTGALVAIALFAQSLRAEEEHSVLNALSSTTLSGYVETSESWWIGSASGPWNDNFAAAELVQAAKVFTSTNLTQSTLEPFEHVHPQQSGSVWYRWPINETGTARISLTELLPMPVPNAASFTSALSDESIFYPWGGIHLVMVTGISTRTPIDGEIVIGYQRWWFSLTAYRQTGPAEFARIQSGSPLEFNVSAGESIWVSLEVYQQHFPGVLEAPSSIPQALYFDVTPTPANDSFASNFSVSHSAGGTFTGHVIGATRESGEPDLGPDFSGDSVWFHFTAATYGKVTIGSSRSSAPLAIFTGSQLSQLKLVAKTACGELSFFGEEGKTYHIAVYSKPFADRSIHLAYTGPKYRLYEPTLNALMPPGLFPHFYGLRGATLLLYAKSATGWDCVEIEPIVNYSSDLLIRPANAVDGQLRVITIDETLPAPRVQLRPARGLLVPDVIGYPGQTCAISYSTDLVNWSTPSVHTLTSAPLSLAAVSSAVPTHFFRVIQSLPQPAPTQIVLQPQPPTETQGGSGVTSHLQPIDPLRDFPPPPVPPL